MITSAMSECSSGRQRRYPNGVNYSPYYRQLYLDDRDRAQAKFAVDVKVLEQSDGDADLQSEVTIPTSSDKTRKV